MGESQSYIINTLYPGTATANIPEEKICKEVVTRYNGGKYYERSGGSVVVGSGSGFNPDYIEDVEPFYNHFISPP
jgi:hypothetical protein